jgi:hypothetical protein
MDAILCSNVFEPEFIKQCSEFIIAEISKPELRQCIENYFLDPCVNYLYRRFRFCILSGVALTLVFCLLLLAVIGTVLWLGAKVFSLIDKQ